MSTKISDFFTKKVIIAESSEESESAKSEALVSIKLESEENCSSLEIKFTSSNNSGQENQNRINENVKTEAEKQLLVILPQQNIHKLPVPIKIEKNETKTGKFGCQICDKNYSSKQSLFNHVRSIHQNPGCFKCKICNAELSSKGNLHAHQKIHMKNRQKPFKCGKCNIILKNRPHDCRLDCKFCGKKFSHREGVLTHIKMNHAHEIGKRCYECDICGLKFYRKKSVRIHMDKKHADGKIQTFTCDLDGKTFKVKAKIVCHVKIHQLPVKCDFCHIKINSMYLKKHIENSHTGIKQPPKKQPRKKPNQKTISFQCLICSKILTTKSILKRHVSEHNKNKM